MLIYNAIPDDQINQGHLDNILNQLQDGKDIQSDNSREDES